VLAWYAEGVNAFIAQNPGRLGAEFNLLRVRPQPWSPIDSITYSKVMAWSLCVNWESELTRLRLVERLGPVRAAELEPDYPKINPIILEGAGSSETMRLLETAGLLLNEYEKVRAWFGDAPGGKGSNSWALAPKNSQTRRAWLCNDTHLALQIPGTWYENHLSCPEFSVSGASLSGAPGVVLGHNEQIAWGFTNAFPDVQDLFIERAHPDDPTLFAYGEGWEKAQIYEEQITVRRRAEPYIERVVVTRHGPIISGMIEPNGERQTWRQTPLALKWTGHSPGHLVAAVQALNRARNWDEFQTALANWSAPPQNATYADALGNIGYVLAGSVPLRRANLGLAPAPGWDPAYEWDAMIPAYELPRLYNPASGKIVTANHKIVGDDYPYFLGVEFFPGWRAARLEEMLSQKERHGARDMEEMQLDTYSKYAEQLAPWFGQLDCEESWERLAVNYLRKWDHRMDSESAAALIYQYAMLHLLELVFGDKLGAVKPGYFGITSSPLFLINGFMMRAQTRLLALIAEHEQSFWYSDAATGAERTRSQLLKEALRRAMQQIRNDLGDSARRWNWGRVHQIRYAHPLGSVRLLRSIFNRGPFPVGGDETTPNQTRHPPILPLGLVQITAAYRQIYEVGVWDGAKTVTTGGQSGHPLSDHYDDQITLWREGVYHRMPWTRQAVEAAARYRMVLEPGTR
jgi:penicillin amidase